MATVYITEFSESGFGQVARGLPIASLPAITTQTRTVSGTSAQSSAFNAKTKVIRVHTDAICSILVGADPTATTSNMRLPADHTEYFAVQPGDKLAAITNT